MQIDYSNELGLIMRVIGARRWVYQKLDLKSMTWMRIDVDGKLAATIDLTQNILAYGDLKLPRSK